jgi:uncharacterized protein YneF (UPF0154 family)
MFWCTFALVLSLVVFVGSYVNRRQTADNLRDAQRLIDEIDRRTDPDRR